MMVKLGSKGVRLRFCGGIGRGEAIRVVQGSDEES